MSWSFFEVLQVIFLIRQIFWVFSDMHLPFPTIWFLLLLRKAPQHILRKRSLWMRCKCQTLGREWYGREANGLMVILPFVSCGRVLVENQHCFVSSISEFGRQHEKNLKADYTLLCTTWFSLINNKIWETHPYFYLCAHKSTKNTLQY